MKIRLLILLLITASVSTGMVSYWHMVNRANHEANDFVRLFPPHQADVVDSVLLDNSDYVFSGSLNGRLLIHSRRGHTLLSVDTALNQPPQTIARRRELRNSAIVGTGRSIFLTDENTGTIKIVNGKDTTICEASNPFIGFAPAGNHAFVTREMTNYLQATTLAMQNAFTGAQFRNEAALEKQIDGIFCTDGMLLYDSSLSVVVYVYRYRNQYLVFDSVLNDVGKGTTIDTNRIAKIKIKRLKDRITLASPPQEVNKMAAVQKGSLYISSPLIARNEILSIRQHRVVFDVYDLQKLQYWYSFYVPKPVSSFALYGNALYATQNSWLVRYQLKPPSPPHILNPLSQAPEYPVQEVRLANHRAQ